ncbi:hypothetical protein N9I45_00515 [bacterium]|nr:hypothetical protein [bacterium]
MDSSDKMASGQWKYKEKTKAKIRDLIFYLGEDWIDYGAIGNDLIIEKYKNEATSAYQPKKCHVCNKYWHVILDTNNHKKSKEYLRTSIFGSSPAIKEKCWKC